MIDNKGRIGGKLNIIDLIAIILIIAVIALVGMKIVGDRSLSGDGTPIVYTVEVKNVKPEVYEQIKNQLPSQLMASGDLLDGYVTEVQATPSQETTYSITNDTYSDITILNTYDAGSYDLVFTIEATVANPVLNEVGTQEVRVGKDHIVKTTSFELEDGTVLTLDYPEAAAE